MGFRLDHNNLEALLAGFEVLGTGGGGDTAWGREIIRNDWERGRQYNIVSLEDVPDGAMVCSGGIMGSVKAFEAFSYREIVESWEAQFLLVNAIRLMERTVGKTIDYLIPFEIGGLNTPVVMSAAARLNIPVIDADFVGRAAPETHMTACIGLGADLYPMTVVDSLLNEVVVLKSASVTYADELGRLIVGMGGNYAANSHYPMMGAMLKRVCVPGAVSRSVRVGEALLGALQKGEDSVASFIKTEGGEELFRGRIAEITAEEKVGFYVTRVRLNGSRPFVGSRAELVIKNETMALFVDGRVRIMFPDLACMFNLATGRGIFSNDLREGVEISVVGLAAHENLRACMKSEVGKQAHAGARYGCPELAYRPMEELR